MFIEISTYIINIYQITDIVQNPSTFPNGNQVWLSNGRSYLLSDKDIDKIFAILKSNNKLV